MFCQFENAGKRLFRNGASLSGTCLSDRTGQLVAWELKKLVDCIGMFMYCCGARVVDQYLSLHETCDDPFESWLVATRISHVISLGKLYPLSLPAPYRS